MVLGILESIRHSRLTQISTAMDAGATGALLRIYDNTAPGRPATGAAITTQVLLATLTFSTTAFAAPTGGSMTAAAITADSSADANGTAAWFRIVDSAGTFVMDGSVGTSGADLNLSSVSITAGGSVSVSSFVLTEGNA